MLRKIIAGTITAALICGLTGGCAKNKKSDVTTITVWTGNGHDKSYLTEKVEEWNKTVGAEKKIRIEYTVQNNSMEVAFSNGTAPDLFAGADLVNDAAKGRLLPVSELTGGNELVEKYKDYLREGLEITGGKVYSIPYGFTTYGLIYNKDMFKAAGIVDENGEAKPPKTLSEMREDAKKLTNASKKEYGYILPTKDNLAYDLDIGKWSMTVCGFPNGANPKTGKRDVTGITKMTKSINALVNDKSIMPGSESMTNDAGRAKFSAGGVGMKSAGSYDFGVLTEQFPAKIDWGVAPFPGNEDGETKYRSYAEVTRYLYINAKSAEEKGLDKLSEVYKWFYSDELVADMYKNGLRIPIFENIINETKVPEDKPQWKEFAELVKVSNTVKPGTKADLKNKRSFDVIWTESIFRENLSDDEIEKLYKEAEEYTNEAIDVYYSEHPEENINDRIFPDWNDEL